MKDVDQLTCLSVRWQCAIHLIAGWMQIPTTRLVKVRYVDTATCVIAVNCMTTEPLTYILMVNVAITHRVLRVSRYFLWFAVSGTCRLFNLLVILYLILLEISMSLRMWEILLICILLETAGYLILRMTIEALYDVCTLVVLAAVRVIHFLHASGRRSERMRINLRVVTTNIAGSLHHIDSTIGLTNFFHFVSLQV